jgi:hypothetical protein
MTLITRLSTAFTDTTLPLLKRDPVLPNVGGRYLIDAANTYSISGLISNAATANTYNAALYSLTDDGIATTGVLIGDHVLRDKGPGASGVPADMEDAAGIYRAGIGYAGGAAPYFWFPDQPDHPAGTFAGLSAITDGSKRLRYIESERDGRYPIDDPSHGYTVSVWIKLGTSSKKELFNRNLTNTVPGGSGYPGFGLAASSAGISVKRDQTGAFADFRTSGSSNSYVTNSQTVLASPSTATIYRIGYAWYWDASASLWREKWLIDDGTVGTKTVAAWDQQAHGIDLGQGVSNNGSAQGVRTPYAVMGFGGDAFSSSESGWWGSDHKLYRLYIEDNTRSGRTPEQVWAADWARGNGRFS